MPHHDHIAMESFLHSVHQASLLIHHAAAHATRSSLEGLVDVFSGASCGNSCPRAQTKQGRCRFAHRRFFRRAAGASSTDAGSDERDGAHRPAGFARETSMCPAIVQGLLTLLPATTVLQESSYSHAASKGIPAAGCETLAWILKTVFPSAQRSCSKNDLIPIILHHVRYTSVLQVCSASAA